MPEYIRRTDALKAVDCGNLHKGIVDALQSLILDVPVADVRPVVRGTWIRQRFTEHVYVVTCSVCHAMWCIETNFCSECGADMREETENA